MDRKVEAIQAWLDETPSVGEPSTLTQQQQHDVEQLLGHPGMYVLLGLMISTRQGFFYQLSNTALGTPEGVVHAAAIQGIIRGIDLLPQTLLELALPAEAETPQEQQP